MHIIYMHTDVQTTLGFRVEHVPGPGRRNAFIVQHVIIGSAAHMDGDILEGDEVCVCVCVCVCVGCVCVRCVFVCVYTS